MMFPLSGKFLFKVEFVLTLPMSTFKIIIEEENSKVIHIILHGGKEERKPQGRMKIRTSVSLKHKNKAEY